MRRDITLQNFGGDIQKAHVGDILPYDALHRRKHDVGAELHRDIVLFGRAAGKLRDEAAVPAAHFQLYGPIAFERRRVIDGRAEGFRRFFEVDCGIG